VRKTKILATLGPATNDVEILKKMIESGLNGARINFSHGNYESHGEMIKKLKQAREEMNASIPLLLDTKGPEIRVKSFEDGQVSLEECQDFTLTTNDIMGNKDIVTVTYESLAKDMHVGDRILLDDGLIELKVKEVTETDVICTVINGGILKNNKGVNIPDVYINLPPFTEKDVEDILFGIKMGFDYVAASFIRKASDVLKIREILEKNGGEDIKIISKIENRDGVDNINEILDVSDGIMVARGDLGVEIDLEEVPLVQKKLIKKANLLGKTVVTATQMLESMISNPRPTRAEANDVANAIFDGTDVIMLSGETASGKYPSEAIATMARIAEKAEDSINYYETDTELHKVTGKKLITTDAIGYATCAVSNDLKSPCIATVTNSGFTARKVAKFRPTCPVIAITDKPITFRQMALIWGCIPIFDENVNKAEDIFKLSAEIARKLNIARTGDNLVVAAGLPLGEAGTTNTIRVVTVGDVLLKGKSTIARSVSGKACVVTNVREAEKTFQKGDILVCNNTDNSMMHLIRRCSAIILGSEGNENYDHAYTVGQALDIPVVVCNTKVVDRIPNATNITIDGKKGLIYNGIREL